MVIEYLRDKGFRPIGCLVAVKVGNDICFGWSKVNKKKEKIITKDRGRSIALARTEREWDAGSLPYMIIDNIDQFTERCQRYYKNSKLEFSNVIY